MEDKSLYVRLSAGIMRFFRSAYAYVDTWDNHAEKLLLRNGVRIKKKDIYTKNGEHSNYLVVVATLPRSKRTVFEECMERHRKDSIILGWGNTEEYMSVVDDIHRMAEA